jgi:hypothetical protein
MLDPAHISTWRASSEANLLAALMAGLLDETGARSRTDRVHAARATHLSTAKISAVLKGREKSDRSLRQSDACWPDVLLAS